MSHSSSSPRYWIIVPAAGVGARMGAGKPKQYLTLLGKTILEHTIGRLLSVPDVAGLLVAVSPDDDTWPQLSISTHPGVTRINGGAERSYSVLNALDALSGQAEANDWVLVHDAARPCITPSSIQTLCVELADDPVGGILAVPVSDTVKRVSRDRSITQTLDRSELWLAQTPQLFRYGLLRATLADALARCQPITDEASALEAGGYPHRVVEGRADNIKITRPEDLALAQTILQQQEQTL
ncbi:MAG: 2-C-methyl-D-erythritol 4-phosphate cytidylyltransferase [Cellvibrio sp.]|jgi:2-C-methyl-D-erythritol 4-phosphate cytidylyltransferase